MSRKPKADIYSKNFDHCFYRRFLKKQVNEIALEKKYGISFLSLSQLPNDAFFCLYFLETTAFPEMICRL